MNRFVQGAAILPLIAWGLTGQEAGQTEAIRKRVDLIKKNAEEEMQVKMDMVGSVRGPLVKGLPYSADEITETNQVLADGTKIHRETKFTVYRDTEGRTRRESPESVTISDPVAGTTYMINPKTNSVRRLQMANTVFYRTTNGGPAGEAGATFSMRTDGVGQANIEVNGKQLDPKAMAELIAKAKAEGHAEVIHREGAIDDPPMVGWAVAAPATRKMSSSGGGESLGKKNIEGVIAEGNRSVERIETGAIGNDRPIEIVNESWFSEEIGQMVYSKRSDPRTGEEVFRLMNIRRGDPPAYLFQTPAETRTGDRKE